MADNPSVNSGSGITVGADDISSVYYQRIKIVHGSDGVNDGDTSTSNGLPVQHHRVSSATLSNVSGSASSVSLLASNSSRKGATIFNDSSADLYVKYGATASTSSFTVKIAAAGYWEMPWPVYTGAIDGIWGSATGAARITEL
jgi:hypothetical protein